MSNGFTGQGLAAAALMAAMLATGPALAEGVPVEEGMIGTSKVRLYVHPFLQPDELATLRLVMTNEQALQLFVPNSSGFAALAASPGEGVIRDGQPVASAVALAEMPDAAAASKAATTACDAARKAPEPCLVVLEVAPAE